jgi:hypothetical protein
LRALAQLQHVYFDCYLKGDLVVKQLHYEKILCQKYSLLLRKMGHARHVLKKNKETFPQWCFIFSKIEHISEIIFSLNQLRYRVKGHAIFEVCRPEMQGLEKTSTAELRGLANFIVWKKRFTHSTDLLDKIHAFEAISQRALQVASPEPLVFLFFIQDLYALYDEIRALAC